MNMKVILVGLVIFISFALIVSANMVNQGSGIYINTVYLEQGWNIIPGTFPSVPAPPHP